MDRKTPFGGEWFVINFGNTRSAVVPAASPRLMDFNECWTAAFVPENGDMALERSAGVGTDLWTDPQISNGLFVGGAPGSALGKAKVTNGWSLTKCRWVDGG